MTIDAEMNAVSPGQQPALRELEWRIVEMARADGPRSLNPDGLAARIARKLFGISIPRPLANEGLEALRRFSVRAWHWSFVRPNDIGTLVDSGYSRGQALHILEHIAAGRGCMPWIQDDLLRIGPGLEGSLALSRRASGTDRALPALQVPSLAPQRGQSASPQGMRPCPCK